MSRNIRVHCLNLSAFTAVCLFFSPAVQAQNRSLNQGGNNQSASGLSAAGQSSLSLGANSLQPGGVGSFTQQAGGGTPGGQQQGGFIGRGSNANQFIGRGGAQGGQSLQRNTFSQSGRNRNAGGGNNRGGGRTGNRTGTSGTQRVIRPRLRIAFSYPRPSVTVAVSTLSARFERLNSRRPSLSGVRITTGAAGEVTLQGSVDSAETRKLAELMTRMQPGVRKVLNELIVSADASGP